MAPTPAWLVTVQDKHLASPNSVLTQVSWKALLLPSVLSLQILNVCCQGIVCKFTFFFLGPDDIEEEREVDFGKRRKLHSVYDVHEEIGR